MVTSRIGNGRSSLGFIDSDIVFSRADIRLEGTWIEFEKQIAFFHVLPVRKVHLDNVTSNARAHVDRLVRPHPAIELLVVGHLALLWMHH